jgi:ABC-type ATPase involved in cell division
VSSAATRGSIIQVSHVSKRYAGGFEALRDVTFSVESGEMVFITGHSGAGKSTLLKLITAIERPTAGGVIINGQNVSAMKRGMIPFFRRNFGLIFQDHKLLFDRSVFENVALPLAITGFPRGEIAKRARAALDKVGHDFGPNSHEIQDVLIRLDRTLGGLFAGLDRLVGAGNYTVALTADHGVDAGTSAG